MFSKIFIERPKLAFVISIVTVLVGMVCIVKLPIAEYPEIAPPTIVVSATYPGATSQVMAETVGTIIEEQVNGIEDMMYFSSSSTNSGTYQLTLTFESGCDSDMEQVRVQNAVKRAENLLPDEVLNYGVTVAKRSTDIVGFYMFTTNGEELSQLDLSNYIRMNVKDAMARIPGMGSADLLGGYNYSMRVWLDPIKMYALGLSVDNVIASIRSQNVQAAAGSVGAEEANNYLQFKVDTQGRLSTVEEFSKIIVYSKDGKEVTLDEIAEIELGRDMNSTAGFSNGEPCVALGLYRQEGANAVKLIDDANALMKEISTRFPKGVTYDLAYDPTQYIRTSIKEIAITLVITLVLVVAITFIFLQDWRATLIPTLAIPVSLVGTFLFMAILGYSINVLTMFGLILVIGSLVDDAICVVENTMRIIEEEHLSPKEATLKSMQQITGAIIATTLVTVAVYAPIGFYGGVVGTIYKQFAVTMCVALCLSTVNALTLSPALCAMVLKPYDSDAHKNKFIFYRWFDKGLAWTKIGYIFTSKFMIRRVFITVLLLLFALFLNFAALKSLNSGFLPDEDKGAVLCAVELAPGASLARTNKAVKEMADKMKVIDGVEKTLVVSGFSFIGGQGENLGLAIADLADWEERETPETSVTAIRDKIMIDSAVIPSAKIQAFTPPAIMGLGITGGVTFAFQSKADETPKEFEGQLFKLLGMLNNKQIMPDVAYAFSSYNASSPLIYLDIDRRKAEALEVPINSIFAALQTKLASAYVNDFNIYGYSFRVKVQVDSEDRTNINNLQQLQIPNRRGEMIPLNTLANVSYIIGPRTLDRFNQSMSATVNVILLPGATSGKVMEQIKDLINENYSRDYTYSWTDMSYQEDKNEGQIYVLFLLSCIFAYLFLVAQYESWTIPIPVMLSVMFATLGGLFALNICDRSFDIYAQLGLLMLIGLSAKSAILMVEFSMQQRATGVSIEEAALNGANTRYRAVLMTALSFVIGVVPLMVATGAGSVSRQIIGITTGWGMIVATFVGIAFIPPLYYICQSVREKVNPPKDKK